jgi:hypothetical protein
MKRDNRMDGLLLPMQIFILRLVENAGSRSINLQNRQEEAWKTCNIFY